MRLIPLQITTDHRLQKDITKLKLIHLYAQRLLGITDKNHYLLHCTKLDSEQASAEYGT